MIVNNCSSELASLFEQIMHEDSASELSFKTFLRKLGDLKVNNLNLVNIQCKEPATSIEKIKNDIIPENLTSRYHGDFREHKFLGNAYYFNSFR